MFQQMASPSSSSAFDFFSCGKVVCVLDKWLERGRIFFDLAMVGSSMI